MPRMPQHTRRQSLTLGKAGIVHDFSRCSPEAGVDTGGMNASKKLAREDSSERALALGVVVAFVLFGGALIGLVSLMSLNWVLRSEPFWSLPTPPTRPGRPQPLEIVRVALTIVAGVGGLVALTVAYRRQLWLEADTTGERERRKALHDRYVAAVAQLGHENPNVRLAGVLRPGEPRRRMGSPTAAVHRCAVRLHACPLGPRA